MVASSAATLTDLGTLFVAVTLLGISARVANVPALLLANVVSFFTNRHFAFRAGSGRFARQAPRFVGVQIVAITLNAALFDLGMRALATHAGWYWALRLAVDNAVYLAWTFPMFQRVFRLAPSAS